MSEAPARLIHLDAARRRYGARADRLAGFFHRGDPLADDAALSLRALGPRRNEVLQAALRLGIDAVPDAPEPLVRLFRQLEHVPFWVDPERCTRGGAAFLRTGAAGGLALGFASLARSYCTAGGNKPLVLTGRLVRDAPRRLAETGEFVWAVSQPGALERGQPGYQALIHVRLVHARVRLGLSRDPRWRTDQWGTPINQADSAGTVLMFSHVLSMGVRRLGTVFSREQEVDLLHLWRRAGYLLGVEEELLCATPEEAEFLLGCLEEMDAGPDEDSRLLFNALLNPHVFDDQLPNPAAARAVYVVHQAVARMLLGDERADALGLPRTPAMMMKGARPWLRLLGIAAAALPFAEPLRLARGNAYWRRFIAQHSGPQPAHASPA